MPLFTPSFPSLAHAALAAVFLAACAPSLAPEDVDAAHDDAATPDALATRDAAFADAPTARDAAPLDAIAPDAPRMRDAAVAVDAAGYDAATTSRCAVASRAHTHAIAPAADATAAFVAAVHAASLDPVASIVGPSGAAQGMVYLPAGVYGLNSVTLDDAASNVRIEIEPGATIHALMGSTQSASAIFFFGNGTVPVHNVTFTAGDGQCGPGTRTPAGTANKPSNTGFRGNLPGRMANGSYGMANEPVPYSADWDVAAMWVVDLDPRATGALVTMHGFQFHWCYDVLVENVFSIQNPERVAMGSGPGVAEVPNVTSHGAVMTYTPYLGAPYFPDREANHVAHRVTVSHHYNILSPAGFGPNQITSCFDCTVSDVFSHGGTTLRLETDGIQPTCGYDACQNHCDGGVPLGPNGAGFDRYGMVDNLNATRIEGVDGDRVVSLSPHCLPNGDVHLSDLRGTDMYELIRITSLTGTFGDGSTLRDLQGSDGTTTQEPQASLGGWTLSPSDVVFSNDTRHYMVQTSGSMCWPTTFADGTPPTGAPMPTRPPCPAWP